MKREDERFKPSVAVIRKKFKPSLGNIKPIQPSTSEEKTILCKNPKVLGEVEPKIAFESFRNDWCRDWGFDCCIPQNLADS